MTEMTQTSDTSETKAKRVRAHQTFRYEKPDEQSTDKAIVSLCQTDIIRGAVQVVREGGDNNLHSHTGMDGFWMPRGARYWFESIGDEALELLQVVAFDRSVKNRRVDVDARKFDIDAAERFNGRVS